MTRDQIIQWRKEADDWAEKHLGCEGEFHPDFHAVSDERFAQLARADEREACAKVCDATAEEWRNPKYHFATASAKQCAAAIRSRKDEE